MVRRRLLLLSNSTNHGCQYLEHCEEPIKKFLQNPPVANILFIPYALKDHDSYTEKVVKGFERFGIKVESIHKAESAVEKVKQAEAIFVGGGNTFQLLNALYKQGLIEPIRKKVLEEGTRYIGASAGTNVATLNICTTNDMPIVYPPSFDALNLVPFNINPHYIAADLNSKHMGETRDDRIKQYHEHPSTPPVLGLPEGCWLEIEDDKMTLHGRCSAKLFIPNQIPKDVAVDSKLDVLLEVK